MIRQSFLIFMMLIMAGLGPALAQGYYVKPDKGSASSEKSDGPTKIYNKIKPNSFSKKQSVVKYKDKLVVKNLKVSSMAKVKVLDDWIESGMKPRNSAEIMAYAQAHRAVAQNLMYERRQALIKHLDKKGQILRPEFVKNETSSNNRSALDLGGSKAADEDQGKPQKKVLKKRQIYVKPENKVKPTKVFKSYN